MRVPPLTQAMPPPATPKVPMLDASDLPGEEDWAVVESLTFGSGIGLESDPDADRFADVTVKREAFE